MLQQALVKVVAKWGSPQVLFMNANTLKDYTTDMEFMGHPLPVITKLNKEKWLRTEPTWPHEEDTLPMPAEVITFSNDDLCWLLYVSVEHRNKVVHRALVDQGSGINMLSTPVLSELGYGAENVVPNALPVALVNPNNTDVIGCMSFYLAKQSLNCTKF